MSVPGLAARSAGGGSSSASSTTASPRRAGGRHRPARRPSRRAGERARAQGARHDHIPASRADRRSSAATSRARPAGGDERAPPRPAEVHLDGIPARTCRRWRRPPRPRPGRRQGETGSPASSTPSPAAPPPMRPGGTPPRAPLPRWIAGPIVAARGGSHRRRLERSAAHARPHSRRPGAAADWAARLDAEILPTGSLRLRGRPQVSALPGYETGVVGAGRGRRRPGASPRAGRRSPCPRPLRGSGRQDAPARRRRRARHRPRHFRAPPRPPAREPRPHRPRRRDRRRGRPRLDARRALRRRPPRRPAATGTIRRHPDLLWLRGGRDVAALAGLQGEAPHPRLGVARPGRPSRHLRLLAPPRRGRGAGRALPGRYSGVRPLPRRRPRPRPAWIDADSGLRLRPDYWPGRSGAWTASSSLASRRAAAFTFTFALLFVTGRRRGRYGPVHEEFGCCSGTMSQSLSR